jgi:SOS-response transcriptional repressor LexA
MGSLINAQLAVIKPRCQPQLYRSLTKSKTSMLGVMVSDGNNSEISERILSLLKNIELSPTAASLKAGMSKDGIRNILRKPNSIPRGKTLLALAAALETTPEYILSGNFTHQISNSDGLPYGGIVEAGTYRPVDLLDQLGETRIISLPRDPRFPKAKQYAFEIRGDSMTEANLFEGMWAVAIDYHDYAEFYGDLRDGANVVVSRSRNGDPERELSVKELKVFRDRTELHPRSKNPKHLVQVFPSEHNPDNPVEVQIIAVVANAVWLMKI